jgi:hypothetical protein
MPINLFLPQVTRIPIAGPAPYNTLVSVAMYTYAGSQNVAPGTLSEWSVVVPTNFRLQGFDQRVVPLFDHSTTAWICATGPGEDSTFQYAVNSVPSAGFDPKDGTYFVNIDVALSPPDPQSSRCISFGDPAAGGTVSCYFPFVIQISSFVLVYEPPPPAQPGSRKGFPLVNSSQDVDLTSVDLKQAAGSLAKSQVVTTRSGIGLFSQLLGNLGVPASFIVGAPKPKARKSKS